MCPPQNYNCSRACGKYSRVRARRSANNHGRPYKSAYAEEYIAICAKNFKWLTMLVVRLTDRPIAPSLSGNLQCIDIQVVPPSSFTANLMQLLVTAATKRKNKFVADFRTEGSELNKTLIVRIQWRQQPRPSANAKVGRGDRISCPT